MDRKQVVEIFKVIKSLYPQFEVSAEKVDIWASMMRKMEFERVMAKTKQHATEKKFPPTIAEIAAFAPEKNEHLEKVRKWDKEAANVPDSVKQEFRRSLEKLVKDKAK